MLVFLVTLCSYGQESLQLKLIKSSDLPNTSKEHIYLLEVVNKSDNSIDFTIVSKATNCELIDPANQVELIKAFIKVKTNQVFESANIGAHTTLNFYVKLTRKIDTPLGTWSCTEITIINDKNGNTSNTLVIKSHIPDPKNFN